MRPRISPTLNRRGRLAEFAKYAGQILPVGLPRIASANPGGVAGGLELTIEFVSEGIGNWLNAFADRQHTRQFAPPALVVMDPGKCVVAQFVSRYQIGHERVAIVIAADP